MSRSRRRPARVVVAGLVVALVASLSSSATARAYTYDYQFNNMYDEIWYTRGVAHNYHYLRGENGSSRNYICVKLVRTSNGANYGDVYCSYFRTGHHYAGDTGTRSFGRVDSDFNSNGHTLFMHEEW